MNRIQVRRHLVAAVGTLLTVVLAVGATARATTAAWADASTFAAQVGAGTWKSAESCEIVDTATGAVVGTCSIASVRTTYEWASIFEDGVVAEGSLQFDVQLAGFTPDGGRQARVRVDLSRVDTNYQWNWAAGDVIMYTARNVDWSEAPMLGFLTREHTGATQSGQFTVTTVG